MSCGTGRISHGVPPKDKAEKRENAMRFVNDPTCQSPTLEEWEEVQEYIRDERA